MDHHDDFLEFDVKGDNQMLSSAHPFMGNHLRHSNFDGGFPDYDEIMPTNNLNLGGHENFDYFDSLADKFSTKRDVPHSQYNIPPSTYGQPFGFGGNPTFRGLTDHNQLFLINQPTANQPNNSYFPFTHHQRPEGYGLDALNHHHGPLDHHINGQPLHHPSMVHGKPQPISSNPDDFLALDDHAVPTMSVPAQSLQQHTSVSPVQQARTAVSMKEALGYSSQEAPISAIKPMPIKMELETPPEQSKKQQDKQESSPAEPAKKSRRKKSQAAEPFNVAIENSANGDSSVLKLVRNNSNNPSSPAMAPRKQSAPVSATQPIIHKQNTNKSGDIPHFINPANIHPAPPPPPPPHFQHLQLNKTISEQSTNSILSSFANTPKNLNLSEMNIPEQILKAVSPAFLSQMLQTFRVRSDSMDSGVKKPPFPMQHPIPPPIPPQSQRPHPHAPHHPSQQPGHPGHSQQQAPHHSGQMNGFTPNGPSPMHPMTNGVGHPHFPISGFRPEHFRMGAPPQMSPALNPAQSPALGSMPSPGRRMSFLGAGAPLGVSSAPRPPKRIGTLSMEERKVKIEKYLQKRKQRSWNKKIAYDCRKRVADSRLRVKGRFVTKEQAMKMLEMTEEELNQLEINELRELLSQKFGSSENNSPRKSSKKSAMRRAHKKSLLASKSVVHKVSL